VWPLEDLRAAYKAAHELGLRVHLDGARVFNAAVAQGIDVADIAACCDTVTFCLSKGLGCPAGSVFLGSKEAVDEARRWRKRLGGGMRQAACLRRPEWWRWSRWSIGWPTTTRTRARSRRDWRSSRASRATCRASRRISCTSTSRA